MFTITLDAVPYGAARRRNAMQSIDYGSVPGIRTQLQRRGGSKGRG